MTVLFDIFLYSFIVLFIIACLIVISAHFIDDWNLPDCIAVLVFLLIPIMMLSGISTILFGGVVFGMAETTEETVTEIIPIYSLYNDYEIYGNFVLGCGDIVGREKYSMYISKDGGYTLYNINAHDVIIYEGCDNAHINISYVVEKTVFYEEVLRRNEVYGSRKIGLYVPNGTIIKSFSVGA